MTMSARSWASFWCVRSVVLCVLAGVRGTEVSACPYAWLLQMHPHKHVVRAYGICVDAPDGLVRIVMDMCDEGSLFDVTQRAQPGVCGRPRSSLRMCRPAAVPCC